MGMGFAPTWLRQVSPLLHMTTLTTARVLLENIHCYVFNPNFHELVNPSTWTSVSHQILHLTWYETRVLDAEN